ncbi:hypothetical protein HMPREF9104_02430 [Lentilactobacillus kisonensis F0435]|uniref:Uncharacterized protein n=1 Tax=Lentilactobacillus kisonensis F0435 TaxID=797516 RepID=H1LII9_9LACO|nr:hypothetical protein HMPREF9104_02430 [Lentilactobacillus kisonensis F0435]
MTYTPRLNRFDPLTDIRTAAQSRSLHLSHLNQKSKPEISG